MSASGRFYRLSDEDIAKLAEMSDLVDEMYAKYFREHPNPSTKFTEGEFSLGFGDTHVRADPNESGPDPWVELNSSVIVGTVDLGNTADSSSRFCRWYSVTDAYEGIKRGHAEWMALDFTSGDDA